MLRTHILIKDTPQYKAISELLFLLYSKQVQVHNLSYRDEFNIQDNERERKSHFHMKVEHQDSLWNRGKGK